MRLIRPVTVTPSVLTATNVAEVALWNVAAPYVIGNQVYKVIGGIHEGFTAKTNHTGEDPETDDGTNWEATGPTNRWKMFDRSVQSQTENADSIAITLTLPAGQWADSLAVLNVSAASLRIRVTRPAPSGAVVRDETWSLVSPSGITDWWAYFTEPIDRIADKAVIDLPPYAGATIEVWLTATGGTAKCGALVLGFAKVIGKTQWGGQLGITDYSVKRTDDFGNFEVFERAYSKDRDFNLLVENTFVDQLDTLLSRYRATPALWIGSPRFSSTIVYGFFQDFKVAFEHPPDHSVCALSLRSLAS